MPLLESISTGSRSRSKSPTLHHSALLDGKLYAFGGDIDLNFRCEADAVKELAELSDRRGHCGKNWDSSVCFPNG